MENLWVWGCKVANKEGEDCVFSFLTKDHKKSKMGVFNPNALVRWAC